MFGNGTEDIKGVDADVDSSVGQADEGVVQEYIEPLLIEVLLLLE